MLKVLVPLNSSEFRLKPLSLFLIHIVAPPPPSARHLTVKKAGPHSAHGADSSLLHPPPPFSSSSSSSSLLPSCKGDYGWTQRLQPVTGSCKRHRQQRSVRYLGVRCRGVGHDGKLTPYRGTVVGGRWTHFSPRAKRRKRGRIADITPLYRLAAHTHTHKPRTPVPY